MSRNYYNQFEIAFFSLFFKQRFCDKSCTIRHKMARRVFHFHFAATYLVTLSQP